MNYKRLFISLLIALTINNVVIAQDITERDYFGKVKIGSTIDEIKEAEKSSKLVFDSKDEMVFNETSDFIGNSQNIYSFSDDGKMESYTLSIVNDHKDLANYINDYNKLNESLKKIYGEPDQSVYTTDDKELLSNPAKLAEAIKDGKVVATTVWNKENFTISHILSDSMSTEEMDENVKKVTIITPISHIVLEEPNFYEEEEEIEDTDDSDSENEKGSSDSEDDDEQDSEEDSESDDEDSDNDDESNG